MNGDCTFGEVNAELCRGFAEYLQESANSMRTGEKLSNNSVAGYWSTFRAFLRIAYRNKMISENINDFLERIEYETTVKDSLTLQEIYSLFNTECKIDVLKRACLFSCLTGLRFSDVKALTWDMVKSFADGSKYLDFLAVKTTRQNIVPINDDVLNLMGKRSSGKVFKGLLYYMTQKTMQEWLRAAKFKSILLSIASGIPLQHYKWSWEPISIQFKICWDMPTLQQQRFMHVMLMKIKGSITENLS